MYRDGPLGCRGGNDHRRTTGSSTARTLIDPEFTGKHCWADFWQRTLGLCLPPKLQRGNLPFDLPPRRCWGPDPHCERPLLSALPILSFTKA